MPRLIFKNNFEVALAQPTTTSDTTITIRSGSGFPTLGANERVVATIVDAATGLQFEIITVTAVVGNVLTVQRAQEGTAARAWAAGDMLSIRTTAATLTGTVRNFGAIPSGINLNALTGSWFGQYYQPISSNAPTNLNYPIAEAGILEVFQTSANGTESCIQTYTTFQSNITYQRSYVELSSAWSSWARMRRFTDVVQVEYGGTGQTTIQGMKDAFGFGPVADQSIVPTSMGGTGSADNAQAWLNIRPQGSTPLAGDPVNDYDATTKRWVENLVNTGTVGPSMNGVMNYGVGDFHLRDSRAYIQPYEVVADGQLLNRADWPELWAYAQMLSPIADADWLADPTKRGKYSLGNGTTTFRVPDRNGVQTGSIQALFGRGDGGSSSDDGLVFAAAAPNIIGEIPSFYGFQAAAYDNASGALGMNGKSESTPMNQWNSSHPGVSASFDINFRASRSSPVYGRNSITDNILPRNFVGVWVIRASGGFVAAKTSWEVVNGDSVLPVPGTTVDGGEIKSKYNVGTTLQAQFSMRARADVGGNYYGRLSVYNAAKSVTTVYDFDDTGAITLPQNASIKSGSMKFDFAQSTGEVYCATSKLSVTPLSGGQTMGLASIGGGSLPVESAWFEHWGNSTSGGSDRTRATVVECKVGADYMWYSQKLTTGTKELRVNGACIATAFTQSSDRDLKENIQVIPDATAALRKMSGYTYTLKEDGMPHAGVIAQEAMEAIPEAVGSQYKYPEGDEEGLIPERYYTVDYSAVTGLLVQVCREADERITTLEERIANLEALIKSMAK